MTRARLPRLLAATFAMLGAGAAFAASPRWIEELGGRLERSGGGSAVVLRESWVSDGELGALARVPRLVRVDLAHTRISDLGVRQLRALAALRELDLSWAELVGDEGVVALKELGSLRRLALRGTQVTSATLAGLAGLGDLEALDVAFARVTDEGMPSLLRLRKLRALALGGNRITDAGLAALRGLPALEELDLAGRQRTDSGLWSVDLGEEGARAIGSLRNLRALRVAGLPLHDDDVRALVATATLERLDLRGCAAITDGVVDALAKLPRLRLVGLAGTRVSEAGRARLRAALPALAFLAEESSH
jgi:hypothetical protein